MLTAKRNQGLNILFSDIVSDNGGLS